jgi:hypothetical protein
VWKDFEDVCERWNRFCWDGRRGCFEENCRVENADNALFTGMRLAYIPPSCRKPALFAVKATARKGGLISQPPRRKSKPGACRAIEIKLRINNYHNAIGFLSQNIVHRIQTVAVVAKFAWRDLVSRKHYSRILDFSSSFCASSPLARTSPSLFIDLQPRNPTNITAESSCNGTEAPKGSRSSH